MNSVHRCSIIGRPLFTKQIKPPTSSHRSPGKGTPLFPKEMTECTWAVAKAAEYPTSRNSIVRMSLCDELFA